MYSLFVLFWLSLKIIYYDTSCAGYLLILFWKKKFRIWSTLNLKIGLEFFFLNLTFISFKSIMKRALFFVYFFDYYYCNLSKLVYFLLFVTYCYGVIELKKKSDLISNKCTKYFVQGGPKKPHSGHWYTSCHLWYTSKFRIQGEFSQNFTKSAFLF